MNVDGYIIPPPFVEQLRIRLDAFNIMEPIRFRSGPSNNSYFMDVAVTAREPRWTPLIESKVNGLARRVINTNELQP